MLIARLVRSFLTGTLSSCSMSSMLNEDRAKHTHKPQGTAHNMHQNLGQNVREMGKLLGFNMAAGLVVLLVFMLTSGL